MGKQQVYSHISMAATYESTYFRIWGPLPTFKAETAKKVPSPTPQG
jgi:hypothetical protein